MAGGLPELDSDSESSIDGDD
jgi:hypothetical protein